MEEQLISFETAKLAKEKGFNGTCYNFYPDWDNSDLKNCFEVGVSNTKDKSLIRGYGDILLVPTQSLLQKWLREVYNIDIMIMPFQDAIDSNIILYQYFVLSDCSLEEYNDGFNRRKCYNIYEESLEKALQESLKLI